MCFAKKEGLLTLCRKIAIASVAPKKPPNSENVCSSRSLIREALCFAERYLSKP